MKKSTLIMMVSIVLAIALGVGGTLAYLTSTDEDVNVMTLGNVQIDQFEMQRADGIAHNYKDTAEGDLVEYEQYQQLMPAFPVNGLASDYTAEPTDLFVWGPYVTADNDENQASNGLWNDAKLNGAMDKFVFVKNTGTSDAYFRTWIAYECPEGVEIGEPAQGAEIMVNVNSGYEGWDEFLGFDTITVDGEPVRFAIYCMTYAREEGVLPAGEIARPSLLQVVMTHNATNEDVEALGETYEVLAFTQATQTTNFPDKNTALNAAFGEPIIENHPWKDRVMEKPLPYDPNLIYDANEMYDSALNETEGTLGADIKSSQADSHYGDYREHVIKDAREYTLNLNGHTLECDRAYENGSGNGYTYLFTTAYDGKLTINGEGDIKAENKDGLTCIVYAQSTSEVIVNGGNFETINGIAIWAGNSAKVTINGGSFISSGDSDEELIYSSGGVIDIYGGFFHNKNWEDRPLNVANANRGTGFINLYGGTFVNCDPSTGVDDPNNILIAEGYKVISETQANGDIWYTVVPE